MNNIGSRLREERERLKMTQENFAAACGVGRWAQVNYESNARSPDANYLAAAAEIGVDVAYVITGGNADAGIELDTDLLAEIIEHIESLLAEKNTKFPPNKLALATAMLYRVFKEKKNIDTKMVAEVIDLASHGAA